MPFKGMLYRRFMQLRILRCILEPAFPEPVSSPSSGLA
jgi:hypothetical protein